MTLQPIRPPRPNRTPGTWLRDAAYHASLCQHALNQIPDDTIGGLDIAEQRQTIHWLRVSLVAAGRVAGVSRRQGLDGRQRAA